MYSYIGICQAQIFLSLCKTKLTEKLPGDAGERCNFCGGDSLYPFVNDSLLSEIRQIDLLAYRLAADSVLLRN
jgi:hypothetical protein